MAGLFKLRGNHPKNGSIYLYESIASADLKRLKELHPHYKAWVEKV